MKLLFDNGTPAPLRRHLGDHIIHTAARLGWANLTNGDLLDSAEEAGYKVLITTDQSMRYQQNLSGRHNCSPGWRPSYGKRRADTSATTPKWSDNFLTSWRLLIASNDSTDRSSLSAMWSMLPRSGARRWGR